MSFKWTFILCCITISSQAALGSVRENDKILGKQEFVDINGTTYFIDALGGYNRQLATAMCGYQNMTLVSFDTSEKWHSVKQWLEKSNYETSWFWTSAMRDEGSNLWYWESTGAAVAEFYWQPGQPSIDDGQFKSCINFRLELGGWDDENCNMYYLNLICE